MNFERIFLVGFMCSGKSTVGNLLAKKLGWEFYDVDDLIEKEEGMSIGEIFESKGEDYFRNRELEVLFNISKFKNAVISTGGGLGANLKAMEFMKGSGLVIWIDINFETFLKRCAQDSGRPLLRKGEDYVKELFEGRKGVYSLAHLRVDGELPPSTVCEVILYNFRTWNKKGGKL